MSDVGDHRVLRLERLESRSLLAAGVVDFDIGPGHGDSDRSHSDHHHRDGGGHSSRGHEVAGKIPRSGRSDSTHHRHERPRQDRSVPRSSDPPPAHAQTSHPSSSPELAPIRESAPALAPLANETFAPPQPRVTSAASSRPLPATSQGQPLSRQPTEINDAITPRSSEDLVLSPANASVTQPSDPVPSSDTDAAQQITAAESSITSQASANQENSVIAATTGDPSDTPNGLIDLEPLASIEHPDHRAEHFESWQLQEHTIPSLRQIVQPTAELNDLEEHLSGEIDRDEAADGNRGPRTHRGGHAIADRPERIDQMMRDWIGGPGGLIALDQIELPAIAYPMDATMIDVSIESTVSLHRSLNLVANNVAPAISGRALDTIMASLDRVTTAETQPVNISSPHRVAGAAYSAAAVVASTVAVSTRRKHKHPDSNLRFTGKSS